MCSDVCVCYVVYFICSGYPYWVCVLGLILGGVFLMYCGCSEVVSVWVCCVECFLF